MVGHAAFWIIAIMAAFVCFVRAWNLGKDGLDDQQVFKDWLTFQRSKLWVLFGAGLVLAVFLDAFMIFNPPPG